MSVAALVGSGDFRRLNVDAAAVLVEDDGTVGQCVECVIAATADIPASVPLGATLTNQDVARHNRFTTEALHTASLTV